MKKLISFLLSLAIIGGGAFALVKIFNKEELPDSGGGSHLEQDEGGGSSRQDNGGNGGDSGDGDKTYIYELSPLSSEWDENRYYAWANDVWDSYVLPSFFPEAPTDGEISDLETSYTSVDNERLNGIAGDLHFDCNFESFGLFFYGQTSHKDYIWNALEEEGFIVEERRIIGEDTFVAYSDDWYVYIRSFTNGTDACPQVYNITIVPDQRILPEIFEGILMPQFGYAKHSIKYYDTEHEEYSFNVPPQNEWYAMIEFWAVSQSEIDGYKQDLISAGFIETASNGRYEKNGAYVNVSYDSETQTMVLYVASNEYMTNYWY